MNDPRGNPVSAVSAQALEASERALWRMMSFYGTPIDDLDAAIAAEPAWPLPRLMKAGFLLSLTEPSVVDDARALVASVPDSGEGSGNARERAHRAALVRLAAGDWAGAADAWSAILREHPRDALALQWAHLFDFYRGDLAQLAGRVAPLLAGWPVDDPLHPYVLALHAFGLEESGRYAEAEATGRRALAADARVPWAIHAVAHVMEMQGRHDEGLDWMAARRSHWGAHDTSDGGPGRTASPATSAGTRRCSRSRRSRSRARSRSSTTTSTSAGSRSRCSASTPHRCSGASRSSAATSAIAGVRSSPAGGSTRRPRAIRCSTTRTRRWRSSAPATSCERASGSRSRSPRPSGKGGWNGAVARTIGAPLLHGIVDFGVGDFDRATERIASTRAALISFGGSRAQRDVVDQTLLAAAAQGRDKSVGSALVAERLNTKPQTPLTEHWQARIGD
jgi:hypothetical protein